MKAQIITHFGDPSVFQSADLPSPVATPGHVLVKVSATSVNPIDCKIRSGLVPSISPDFPAILHGDLSGTVVAIGEGVSQFAIGDSVFGCAGGVIGLSGALAEIMLVDQHLIAKMPQGISMQQAAALPLVSITAWMALFDRAKLCKGQSLLIHAGVGGVGHIAIQLAKWCGAFVYTTVRDEAAANLAKSFGADVAINSTQESVQEYTTRLTAGKGFDLIFDTIGGNHLPESFEAAAINGTVVTTAARGHYDLTELHNKGLSLHAVLMLLPLISNQGREQFAVILNQIRTIVEQGKLLPLLDSQSYDLEHVNEAHARVESGEARGKVIVNITS